MFLSTPQTYYLYGLPTTYNSSESNSYLYGEKEFEQRQGLNTYDFLARTYAPDECRFWQPDQNSGKYHWLSPYSYCGGDPINWIDPDGRDLAVVCDQTMYKWIMDEKNGWGFYSEDGVQYEGADPFMVELIKSLKYLISGTVGSQLVNKLVNRSSTTLIKDGSERVDEETLYDTQENIIYINYKNLPITPLENGETERNGPIVLGHEMVHATLGKKQMGVWEIPFENGTVNCAGSEKFVTHYENMLRAEHALPLRTHYIIQGNGETEKRGGQLIDLKTRTSLYYKSDEYIKGIQQPYKYYK